MYKLLKFWFYKKDSQSNGIPVKLLKINFSKGNGKTTIKLFLNRHSQIFDYGKNKSRFFCCFFDPIIKKSFG